MARKAKVAANSEVGTGSESKTLKGSAYIVRTDKGKDSLVQEQTLVTMVEGKTIMSDNTVVLIDDIWSDLLSDGTYKTNGKKYFYWEYEMTDTSNDDVTIQMKFECPSPQEKDYQDIKDGKYSGSYADYWKEKLLTAEENAKKESVICTQEISLPGTTWNTPTETVTVDDMVVRRSDTGISELGNLLSLF